VEAESLLPLLRDPAAVREDPAVITYGYRNHAVRDERYRYIRYSDGSEELYDHRNDPHEWTNLADREDQAAVIARLARYLPAENAPPAAPPAAPLPSGGPD